MFDVKPIPSLDGPVWFTFGAALPKSLGACSSIKHCRSWLAVAWWGRGTQAGFRGWIIHSHEPRLYVRLIFSSTCVSEKSPPFNPPGSFPRGKPQPGITPTVLSPNCQNSTAVSGMAERYWRCTLSSCLTGLGYTGTSLNIIRAGCQTSLVFWTGRNMFVAMSWHRVSGQIHYLIIDSFTYTLYLYSLILN